MNISPSTNCFSRLAVQHVLDSLKPPVAPIPAYVPHESSFEEMTCCLTPEQKAIVTKELDLISEGEIKEVAAAVQDYWKPTGIFCKPYAILSAYRKGVISNQDCATLLHFWSAYNHYGNELEAIPIFLDDACTQVNPRAESILRFGTEIDEIKGNTKNFEKLFNKDQANQTLHDKYSKPHLIHKYWREFIHIMATLPKCQRQILIAPDDQHGVSPKTIGQLVHERVNDFGRFLRKQTDSKIKQFNPIGRIVASVGGYECRLHAANLKAHAVFMLGTCPDSLIPKMAIKRLWPMGGELPDVPHQKEVHDAPSPHIELGVHDIGYHLELLGCQVESHLQLIYKIAKLLEKEGVNQSSEGQEIYNRLKDLDLVLRLDHNNPFFREKDKGEGRFFWLFLARSIRNPSIVTMDDLNLSAPISKVQRKAADIAMRCIFAEGIEKKPASFERLIAMLAYQKKRVIKMFHRFNQNETQLHRLYDDLDSESSVILHDKISKAENKAAALKKDLLHFYGAQVMLQLLSKSYLKHESPTAA